MSRRDSRAGERRREGAGGGVHVRALGASTPVGRDARSSAAAVRAGVNAMTNHPYMVDTAGEPMRVAMARWLDVDCHGVDRLDQLLRPAIEQVLAPIRALSTPRRVALALALPAPRPGLRDDAGDLLCDRMLEAWPGQFVGVATFPIGHAAGHAALRSAHGRIAAGTYDACVVAGVDSYLSPETLEWLEANDQLHGAGPQNNAYGFIPGEGAGAVLVVGDDLLEATHGEPLATVLGVGLAHEEHRIKTDTVCIGAGLTAAFREGLGGLPDGVQVTDVICDLNGEPYRADEFGFACLRTKEAFVSASDFVAPADVWGDVAAASMPLHLMLAAVAAEKAYANGPFAFLWASSESGERGTTLLHVPARERE